MIGVRAMDWENERARLSMARAFRLAQTKQEDYETGVRSAERTLGLR